MSLANKQTHDRKLGGLIMAQKLSVKEYMRVLSLKSCDSCNKDLDVAIDGDNYYDKLLCDECHAYWGIK
jgi:hypothetical protein